MKKNETTNPQLCTYKYSDGTPCNRSLTRGFKDKDGEQYCIFHARNDEKLQELKKQMGIEISNASESFKKDIKIQNLSEDNENHKDKISELRRKYRLNYEGAYFPDGFDLFEKFVLEVDISFQRAIFNGSALFDNATFSSEADFQEANFSGTATFEEATFNGEAYFDQATFSGEAKFYTATFNGMINFQGATFSSVANFIQATFSGEANFCWATFIGAANFSVATFSRAADFSVAKFSGAADFSVTNFSGEANFKEATLSGRSIFVEATFKAKANFSVATFSGEADFREATLSGKSIFVEATFKANANFSEAKFSGEANFREATFSRKADFYRTTFNNEAEFTNVFFLADVSFNRCRLDKGKLEFLDTAFFSTSSFNDISEGSNITFINCCFSGISFLRSRIADTVLSNCYFYLTEGWINKKIQKINDELRPSGITEYDAEELNQELSLLKQEKDKIDNLKGRNTRLLRKNLLLEHKDLLKQPHFRLLMRKLSMRGLKIIISPLLHLFPRGFDSIRKKVSSLGEPSNLIDFGEVKDNYMQLKVNMDRMKDYDLANDFYYGEMEMKRLGEKWCNRKRLFLSLYKTLSGYGNAPVRAVIMFFVLIWIFSFPLFFMKLGIKDLSSQNKNQVSKNYVRLETGFFGNLGEMASLSLYNMTALSNLTRSPYEPLNKWTFYYVSAVQYFIRPVQIALIILAIRRKVKRGEE